MGRAFFTLSILGALAVSTAAPVPLLAQEYYGEATAGAETQRLSPRELDALLAPIALYPDQLLAPMLMAATYPHDVEAAAAWTARAINASLRGDALAFAIEPFAWDPSVKTLAQFPDVLRMLNEEWDWMVRVGNAFYLQETDVMDSVQRLRHQALAAGSLYSTNLQRVRTENDAVIIDMVDPASIYIPAYDPVRAYGYWSYPDFPPYYFSRPLVVTRYYVVPTLWGWSSWEWNRHRIRVDLPRYRYFNRNHPWRSNDDTWRHDRSHRGEVNFRRDEPRGSWRNNEPRRDARDGTWSGRRDGSHEGFSNDRPRLGNPRGIEDRFQGRGPARQEAAPGQAPSEARGRARPGDNNEPAGRDAARRQGFGDRPNRQVYAGPQLTPPTAVAPLTPPVIQATRPRQFDRQNRRDETAASSFQPSDDGRQQRSFGGRGEQRSLGQSSGGDDNNQVRRRGTDHEDRAGNREFGRGRGEQGGGRGRGRDRD